MSIYRYINFITVICIAFILSSCSQHSGRSDNPISGDLTPGISQSLSPGNRGVIAVYDAVIDPESGTFTIEPAVREGSYHFPLNNLFPNVLQIVSYNFGPPFTARVKLIHPMPVSDVVAFDPRVILCLPARTGVSARFETLQLLTNNSVVIDPDGYTMLFDNTSFPGNANPFLAYMQGKPYRQWGAETGVVETRSWTLDLNGFSGPMNFQLVVDVSTNYPAPSTPGTDNSPEPYQLDTSIGDDLSSSGGSTGIEVYVFDWQGREDIQSVKAEAPGLYNGVIDLYYVTDGPYPYSFYYAGTLSNSNHAPSGDYDVLIAATDSISGFTAYNIATATVNPSPIDMVELTPTQLNFSPMDMAISDDTGYVAAGYNGLHIFYVGDPYALEWQSWVNPPGYITDVDAANGYAYMLNALLGLQIVYAVPPDQPMIINTVALPEPGEDILVSGDYAYVTTSNYSLEIIDINPPEEAHIAKRIPFDDPGGMDIDGNYLYVADQSYGLQILDISDPLKSHVENTSYFTWECQDVAVNDNIAWLIGNMKIHTYEVYDKTHPHELDYLELTGNPSSINIENGIGFVTEDNSSMSPGKFYTLILAPNFPGIMSSVTIPGVPTNAVRYGSFVFVADPNGGIFSVSIYDPETISIVNVEKTIGCANKVHADGNYAYVADGGAGLQIVDINPAADAYIVNTVDTPGYATDVTVLGDYAYVADSGSGVQIIDINPATSAHIVKAVNTPDSAEGLYVLAGLAYVADRQSGLQIMDVDPPETATILKAVDTPGNAMDAVLGGYGRVYVADFSNGVVVVNASNISTAYISNTISMSSMAQAVTYMSGWLYVANGNNGLQVVNCFTTDAEYIAKTVDTPGNAEDVYLWEPYIYVADSQDGVAFVDVSTPADAFYLANFQTPGVANGVFVRGTTAYVAAWRGGLRILQSQ